MTHLEWPRLAAPGSVSRLATRGNVSAAETESGGGDAGPVARAMPATVSDRGRWKFLWLLLVRTVSTGDMTFACAAGAEDAQGGEIESASR